MPFHLVDLFTILYIVIWIVLGLGILRESRFQSGIVRMLAIGAVVLGPLGMFAYMGIRYLGRQIVVRAQDVSPRPVTPREAPRRIIDA